MSRSGPIFAPQTYQNRTNLHEVASHMGKCGQAMDGKLPTCPLRLCAASIARLQDPAMQASLSRM